MKNNRKSRRSRLGQKTSDTLDKMVRLGLRIFQLKKRLYSAHQKPYTVHASCGCTGEILYWAEDGSVDVVGCMYMCPTHIPDSFKQQLIAFKN